MSRYLSLQRLVTHSDSVLLPPVAEQPAETVGDERVSGPSAFLAALIEISVNLANEKSWG